MKKESLGIIRSVNVLLASWCILTAILILQLFTVNLVCAGENQGLDARFLPEFEKALQLAEAESWEEAEPILEKLHGALPENKEIANNLAVVYFYRGRTDKATEVLHSVLAADPEVRTLSINLQIIYGYSTADADRQGLAKEENTKPPALLLSRNLASQGPGDSAQQEKMAEVQPPVSHDVEEASNLEQKIAVTIPEIPVQVVGQNAEKLGPTPQEIVQERLEKWRSAWTSGAAGEFISFYTIDYAPEGSTYTDWSRDRRKKILPSRKIELELQLQDLRYDVARDEVIVVFVQKYSANNYADVVTKKQVWVPFAGDWRIKEETVVSTGE